MTKKKEPKGPDGWVFTEDPNGVHGQKTYEAGLNREVRGQDLEDAIACAEEVEQTVGSRALTAQAENRARAQELRAEADALTG